MWIDLAKLLNAIPGCNKEWDKWRKTWHDLKNDTKAKAAANKRSFNRTGGGVSAVHVFDPEENQVLDILDPIQVEGLPVVESVTSFNFEDLVIRIIEPAEQEQVKKEKNKGENDKENVRANSMIRDQKVEKLIQSPPKKRESRMQRLTHTIEATEKMNSQMAQKLKEKRIYHRKKLALMQKNVDAKNRIADALENVAASLRSESRNSNI